MNKQFNFKKERDLGSIIGDTFNFLRQEWKGLLSVVFRTSIIPIILLFVTSTFNAMEMMDSIGSFSSLFQFSILTIFVYILMILVYLIVSLTVYSYIKIYIDNQGEVDYNQVYNTVKEYLLSYLGLGLITTFLIILGALFCLLPGIYLGVVFSVTGSILIFQNKGVFETIGSSFQFVNWKWWETFATMFVLLIIIYVIQLVFSIPSIIYTFIKIGVSINAQDSTAVAGIVKDPIYLFLAFVSNLGQFILYGVTAISYALIYFDINEQKNATGSLEIIETLGKD